MSKNIMIKLFIFIGALVLASCAQTPTFFQMSQDSQELSVSRAQLNEDAFWQGNPRVIWDRLQHIPLSKLEAALPQTTDATRIGWIKLAIISKRYNANTNELVQQVTLWRKEYPSHPANVMFPNNSTLTTLTAGAPPRHIALLLPLQGPNGASGQAVRDGFLSTYYQSHNKTKINQTISFYDTSQTTNVATLYQTAVDAGADMVVGPLMKEDVQALLNSATFRVPVLALNYTDNWGSLPKNVFEFGLSQTDEAQQIADKAWQTGHSRAIVIVANNAWGQRVSKNLISRWHALGGQVVETFNYSPGMDFNTAIANLLHVTPEGDGRKKSANTATPSRRQDFDVVFLLAEPDSARAIVPLLKFYYIGGVPIYATSAIYSGSPNPQKDTDLNGVRFADIPWVLKSSSNSNRLYAIGRDAYTISNQLPRLIVMPNSPLYAATGALTMTSNHKIYHRLPMTTMHNGHP